MVYGGISILSLLMNDPAYMANPLREAFSRAGRGHAGVILVLSLVMLRYIDEANLSDLLKRIVREAIPASAILLPLGFFLSLHAGSECN